MSWSVDLPDVRVEEPRPDAAVVVFEGEHDAVSRPVLEQLFASLLLEKKVVVADFSNAQFVDSSVLHVVFRAHAFAQASESAFRLQLSTAAIVARVFEVTGARDAIPCFSSRDEALRGVSRDGLVADV